MNVMVIRLLSSIGFVVAGIIGLDLAAASETKVSGSEKTASAIVEKSISDVERELESAVIVDARGSGEKKIKGAIFVAANADDHTIHAHLKNKSAMIIVYCGNKKCPASMTLAERLVGLGYTNVGHYAGGIDEWVKSNKPVDVQ